MRIGAHFVTPGHKDWNDLKRQFLRGQFDAAKIMIPVGFSFEPHHVRDLIIGGAREIILRTEDDDYTSQRVYHDLIQRGFLELVDKYPSVHFILEVGNEQNLKGMEPWTGRFWQLQTYHDLRHISENRSNLSWYASMPTSLDEVKVYLSRTEEDFSDGKKINFTDFYDGVATHMYGHYNVTDGGGGDWIKIFNYLKDVTRLPISITEFGINHPLDGKEKGRRYVKWLEKEDPRITGAYLFCVARGSSWPQYETNDAMLDELASFINRKSPEKDSEIELSEKQAIEYIQREIKKIHPEFKPVKVRD